MATHFKLLFRRALLPFLLIIHLLTQGQQFPIRIHVVSQPNLNSVHFKDYLDATKTLVTIQRDFSVPVTSVIRVRLKGTFSGGRVKISSRLGAMINQDFSIYMGKVQSYYTLTTADLQKMFLQSNIDVQPGGAIRSLFSSYLLPEADDYQFCFTAYADTLNRPVSDEDQGCGNPFSITYNDPPQILQVSTAGQILIESGQLASIPENRASVLNVSWNIPVGSNTGRTAYSLIAKEFSSEAELTGLQRNFDATTQVFYRLDNLYANAASLPPLVYKAGYIYAFQVIASDPLKGAGFHNNGASPLFWFKNGTVLSSAMLRTDPLHIDSIYPVSGDFIPFSNFPIIVKINPYAGGPNDPIRNFRPHTEIHEGEQKGNIIPNGTSDRQDLSWQNGPLDGLQKFFTTHGINETATPERASQFAVNDYHVSPLYTRGNAYYWNCAGLIGIATSITPVPVATQGSFNKGMNKPQLQLPVNNAIVDTGMINFSWFSAKIPVALFPKFNIAQITVPDVGHFTGTVNEKWVFELSKQQNFSTILQTASAKIGQGIQFGTTDTTTIRNALYRNLDISFKLKDSGTYYWRVKWLVNPDGPDKGDSYSLSQVFQFKVKINGNSDGGGTTPPAPPSQDDCNANCNIAPPTDITPVTTFGVNSVITIGKFQMKVATISYLPAGATGSGTITVPYFKAPLQVVFSGIRINSAGQVFDGKVTGKINPALPQQMPTVFGMSKSLKDDISNLKTLYSSLTQSSTPFILPLGIDQQIAGDKYVLVVSAITFQPQRATLQAFISLALDKLGTDQQLVLGADSLCFNPKGINPGFSTLFLGNDLSISPQSNSLFSRFSLKGGLAGDRTSLTWNCDGFKELHLSGEALLNPNTYVHITDAGEANADTVRAVFSTTITNNPKEWLLEHISVDRFALKDASDVAYKVTDATLDLDDTRNTAGMIFPERYDSASKAVSWTGFYMRTIEVMLPKGMINHLQNRRAAFSFQNMLIDTRGISFTARGVNVLPLESGLLNDPGSTSSSGFHFGIDTVSLSVQSNTFTEFSLAGGIKIPFSSDVLGYTMAIGYDTSKSFNYSMLIKTKDQFQLDFAQTTAKMEDPSFISVDYNKSQKNKWTYLLRLNLKMDLNLNTQAGAIKLPQLEVQDFIWGNNPDTLDANIKFNSPQKTLNDDFPVTIKESSFEPGLNQFALKFGIGLSLGDESLGIDASTYLRILGVADGGKFFHYSYGGVKLDSVTISGDIKVATIDGKLGFYRDDATFGNGFKGVLHAKFLKSIEAGVVAQFGKVNDNKYWYVDGMVLSQTGFQLLPGVNIKGFGAGAYYHMSLQNANALTNQNLKDNGNKQPAVDFTPGSTQTGLQLVPDASGSWGFRARAFFGPPNSDGYKAMAGITAQFNGSGGINDILFDGALMVMPGNEMPATAGQKPSNSSISGFVTGHYNFPNKIFDLTADMYMDASLTGGMLTGDANGKLGHLDFHADANKWHLFIGTPAQRVGVKLLGFLNLNAYVMLGNDIPGIPPLPDAVRQYLNPPMQRPVTGETGIVFGASAGTEERHDKRYPFGPFYADLGFICGFDIAITKSRASDSCRKGINGWYFDGQLYAYLHAEAGIHIDTWLYDGDFPLASFTGGAYLAGGFPNESYIMGTFKITYSILDGYISGSTDFNFKAGSECAATKADPLADIELVGDLTPADHTANIPCGVDPQAIFNLRVQKAFAQTFNTNGSVVTKNFRANFRSFKLYKGTSTDTIACFAPAITQERIVTLSPKTFLESNTTYTIAIEALFEEKNDANNTWEIHKKTDGTEAVKIYKHIFTTGIRPKAIDPGNVVFSYPFKSQQYFLQGECNKGMVQLQQGQDYLFAADADGAPLNQNYADFISADGTQKIRTELKYQPVLNGSSNRPLLLFTVPLLKNNTQYTINFISKSLHKVALVKVQKTGNGKNAGLNNQKLSGLQVKADSALLYSYVFKTSRYNKLQEKIAALQFDKTDRVYQGNVVTSLTANYSAPEVFDTYDRLGITTSLGKIGPLVKIGSTWNNGWHTGFADANIYGLADYFNAQFENSSPNHRDKLTLFRGGNPAGYNIPPTNAVEFVATSGGQVPGVGGEGPVVFTDGQPKVIISYKVPAIVYQDFLAMKGWINGIRADIIQVHANTDAHSGNHTPLVFPEWVNKWYAYFNSTQPYPGNPYANFSYGLQFFFTSPTCPNFEPGSGTFSSLNFSLTPETKGGLTTKTN